MTTSDFTDDEVEENPNEGVKDCHTCYHSLELHRNGVGCGAIANACSVEECCKHVFPTGVNWPRCVRCRKSQRQLGRCGHYHEENVTCDEGARLIRESFASAWESGKNQVHVVPDGVGVFTLAPPKQLQLVITHTNENVTFHAVGDDRPWKIDAGLQLLIVGKGVGRVMVPLFNIMYFTLEEY